VQDNLICYVSEWHINVGWGRLLDSPNLTHQPKDISWNMHYKKTQNIKLNYDEFVLKP